MFKRYLLLALIGICLSQMATSKFIVRNGDRYNYPWWGGECEIKIVGQEVQLRRLGASWGGVRSWRSSTPDALNKLENGEKINIVWDGRNTIELQMIDDNTFQRSGGYKFTKLGCSNNVNLKSGDKFFYGPWGSLVTATIDKAGEVIMAAPGVKKGGVKSWYTKNGDGQRLLRGENVTVVWDGRGSIELQFKDNNDLWRQGNYKFIRANQISECFIPKPDCSTRYQIETGDEFNYAPWGGRLNAKYENGVISMARPGVPVGGVRSWYTKAGDAEKLLNGEKINVIWDGRAEIAIQFKDFNNIWRQGGYNFARKSKGQDWCADIYCSDKINLKTGDVFNYPWWGGNLDVVVDANGEVSMARQGVKVGQVRSWYTKDGNGAKLLKGEKVPVVWDGKYTNYVQFVDNNKAFVNGKYQVTRVNPIDDCWRNVSGPQDI